MIIDTSALVAVLWDEPGADRIGRALASGKGLIPAPVLVELERVTAGPGNAPDPICAELVSACLAWGCTVAAFDGAAAQAAMAANAEHGAGNGRGGRLNLLDLMVLGLASSTGRPILCTGRDFAATGAALHPASRPY